MITIILFALTMSADPGMDCHSEEPAKKETKSSAITHAAHGAAVDQRHDGFGMSHAATKHSFRLSRDGGSINLFANEKSDEKAIGAIRSHLKVIAKDFTAGEFEKPLHVHGHMPDGVTVMKTMKNAITYKFEETETGGRVVITSKSAEAVDAIHAFLKFQVAEHRTGDKGEIEK